MPAKTKPKPTTTSRTKKPRTRPRPRARTKQEMQRAGRPRKRTVLLIANGDLVKLSTYRGEMELPVWLDGRAKPLVGDRPRLTEYSTQIHTTSQDAQKSPQGAMAGALAQALASARKDS